MKYLSLILSILLIMAQFTFSQVPQTTSFQGVLTDAEGFVLADGEYSLNFRLYNTATEGTLLWEETQVVPTVGGIFNVILGKGNMLNLPFDKQYWLGISINGEDELLPRVELTSSLYSLNTHSIPDKIVTSEKIADRNLVRSINSLTDNVTLLAGSNVAINKTDSTLTISATSGGVGDNLGNHTATQNIKLSGQYLSGDGGNEGIFVATDGKVGIGSINPKSLLSVGADGVSGYAIYSSSSNGGVYGSAMNSGDVYNYGGVFSASGRYGQGVHGFTSGADGHGVHGYAIGTNGYGVYGIATSADGIGVYGINNESGSYGVIGHKIDGIRGFSDHAIGYAVFGSASGISGHGICGSASGTNGYGVRGYATNNSEVANHGGYFTAGGASGFGVYGKATNSGDVENYGGYFTANGNSGRGIVGETIGSSGRGVYGYASKRGESSSSAGFFESMGDNGKGLFTYAGGLHGVGIYSFGSERAGHFYGDVHVSGTISKGGGSFLIDHPLDPENKNLYHAFVESPDMKNIYDGTVTTDGNGNADIDLPEWFEALNKDFRYQLTVIGEFAQAIISQKVDNNRFSIRTDKPNIEVSWQVTGIRKDAFANANRIQVEEMKKPENRGKYQHPKAFGMPETMSINYNKEFEQVKNRMEQQEERGKLREEEEQRIEKERSLMEHEEAERARMRIGGPQIEKQ